MASQRAATSEVSIFNLPVGLDEFTLVDLPASESFHPAVSITTLVSGGNIVAFVTAERRLYLMTLRQPPAQSDSPRIVQILRTEKVIAISCGCSHVVVITSNGTAYLLEVGHAACLDSGRGAALAASARLVSLQVPGRAAAVSCGEAHVLIAMESGALFAFGDGSRGQLGVGSATSKELPVHISGIAHSCVVGVAAGRAHSCAITQAGSLLTWGDNRYGQLGDGSSECKYSPQLLKSLEAVRCVVAFSATAAICANGSSYAWGFRNLRVPTEAFDRQVCRLALSSYVLCGVSLSGELLLRGLGGSSSQTFLVQRGVAEVAAVGCQVVSLGGTPTFPIPASITPASLPSPSRSPFPGQGFQMPQMFEKAGGPFRDEVAELQAFNVQLSMKLDEARAEHLFESVRLQHTEDAAAKRSVEAVMAMESKRAEFTRVENLLEILRLQEELETARNELRNATGRTDIEKRSHVDSADAVTQELIEKCAQLTTVHARLCEEREAVQSRILVVRGGLTESGQRLKRIEDACVRTRAILERRQAHMKTKQDDVSRAESELRRAETRLPSIVDAGSRLEQAVQNARFEALKLEGSELRQEKNHWSKVLVDLQSCLENQKRDDHQLLSEARCYTQEHATEEKSLARQQLVCSRCEGEISSLRSENSQAQKQAIDLHQFSFRSEQDAQKAANDALQHCNFLRTQIGSGDSFGLQRVRLMQVVSQLREKLASANAEHAEQSNYLRDRANQFAEETAPLYSEVQRLHAALTNLRKCIVESEPCLAAGEAFHGIALAT